VVTITGANDPAVITGTNSASLTETDGVLSTDGSLSISDVDTDENSFQSRSNVSGSSGLGSFNVDSTGVWTYVTNNAGSADYLTAGQTITDSFVVSSFDGSASQTISVTITGTERNIYVDETGVVFADNNGNNIKEPEETVALDGLYNFSADQVNVTFTGIPATQSKVNLSGFGSDDKVIINYNTMTSPYGYTSGGTQNITNFATLGTTWLNAQQSPTIKLQNFAQFKLSNSVKTRSIQLNHFNTAGNTGKLQAILGGNAKITQKTRTFAIWNNQTSIPFNDPTRVSITWPTVLSTT
jgi:VCBS repeat-containing protein